MVAACVECEAEFEVDEPELGEILTCPECGLDMEVVSPRPLELEAVSDDLVKEEDAGDEERTDWN